LHPILFKLGPLTLYTYGLCLAIGFIAGMTATWFEAKRRGVNPDRIFDMAILAIIAAIVGSRLLYVIVFWEKEFKSNPISVLYIQEGGLVFIGGFIAVIATLSIYLRYNRIPYWWGADMIIPACSIGHVFGRIGCFFNGCCYGRVTTGWYGIVFPNLSQNVARHPSMLYEAGFELALFIFLVKMNRQAKTEGMTFVSYLVYYSLWRFFIEFTRDDDRGALWHSLTISQWSSIAMMAFAIIVTPFLFRRMKGRKYGDLFKREIE
jgi:phosphatidylglycerol---prolipoprotein diacylglyceryl transferase